MIDVDASFTATLLVAFTMGVATFFSPCAFPLLPGYVGFYVSQTDGEQSTLGGAIARGLVAGAGVLVTFLVLIGGMFVVGQGTLSQIDLLEPIIGGLFIVFGVLIFLDRAPSFSIALPKRRSSVLGFGIFGAGYALAAAGCVAPMFIGVVVRALTYSTGPALLVVGTYVGGIVILMVSLTVATGMGVLASAGRLSAYSRTLEQLAGIVMILAGLGQVYLAIFYLNVL